MFAGVYVHNASTYIYREACGLLSVSLCACVLCVCLIGELGGWVG